MCLVSRQDQGPVVNKRQRDCTSLPIQASPVIPYPVSSHSSPSLSQSHAFLLSVPQFKVYHVQHSFKHPSVRFSQTHSRNTAKSTEEKQEREGNCEDQSGKLLIFILQFFYFKGQLMELDNSARALRAQSWLVVRVVKPRNLFTMKMGTKQNPRRGKRASMCSLSPDTLCCMENKKQRQETSN